ncbi:Hypothetical predicted protein, partial [Pelobates cultripes]
RGIPAYQRALNCNRGELLQDKPIFESKKLIRCIANYDAGWTKMRHVIGRFWPLLTQDLHLKDIIPPKGTYQCGRCVACMYIAKGSKTLTNSTDSDTINVRQFFNCNTTGIVYLLTCKCGLKYVGKTIRPFKKRIMEHVHS